MDKSNIYYVVLNTANNKQRGFEYHHTTVKPDDGVDFNTMFKTSDGTCYNTQTPDKVVQILERARRDRTRLVFDYGDATTGKSWGECYDIVGYIGRSTGTNKIPILVFNSRSWGGGAISDDCIIKISESKGKRMLYVHPTYQAAE
jgi:hypothetical protein